MNTNQNSAVNVVLPVLPRLPRARKGSIGVCLCGCAAPTSSRFAPGHDSRLLAWTLRVERGIVKPEATGLHRASVEIEVALRAKAGLTGMSHAQALIQPADAVAAPAKPKAAARKPRLVKAKRTNDSVELALNDNALPATGTE